MPGAKRKAFRRCCQSGHPLTTGTSVTAFVKPMLRHTWRLCPPYIFPPLRAKKPRLSPRRQAVENRNRRRVITTPVEAGVRQRSILTTVQQVLASAKAMPDRLLLLGVLPDCLKIEYGWIQRGTCLSGSLGYPLHAGSSFLDKPELAQADAHYGRVTCGTRWCLRLR